MVLVNEFPRASRWLGRVVAGVHGHRPQIMSTGWNMLWLSRYANDDIRMWTFLLD